MELTESKQMQAITKETKNILQLYIPAQIQAIIARGKNLETDAIQFENIAAKEILIKKIKDKETTIAQLEKEKQAITAEIQKIAAQKKQAAQKKIKKQKRKEQKKQQPTQPQELPLPKLPIPPLNIKPPKSKLQQTVAIKRTLMRANSCNTEIELKKVYFDYCERTNSRCIFKTNSDYSAWHYSRKTNLLEIFISDEACGIFHDSSSSSDDS